MSRGYVVDRDDEGLTAREREVVDLLMKGLDQVQIGARLGITKQRVGQIRKSAEAKGAETHAVSHNPLSARERQVLVLIREGHGDQEIGRRLDLDRSTVGKNRRGLVAKGFVIEQEDRTYVLVEPFQKGEGE